ncbi:MAG: family 78 glycoside hydrolase catalytic domain [Clostridiales bacterium]|jgi:hypothetical protein|nr:family 78 glycoside hydrolase catalytic domain [Clostridiales bacterium]
MFRPDKIRIDYGALRGDARCRISTTSAPVLQWSVLPDETAKVQSAYRIQVTASGHLLWDTGWTESAEQFVRYQGNALPVGERIEIEIRIKDQVGRESLPANDFFYFGQVADWKAAWIASSEDIHRKTVYFCNDFILEREPEDAYLLICGLGYHKVFLNETPLDFSLLDPAYSDYTKTCYYAMIPELASHLSKGRNTIRCAVGEGWRRLDSSFIQKHLGMRRMRFEGTPQLSAILFVKIEGTWSRCITTDSSWNWTSGPLVSNNLYDGIVYDARLPFSPQKQVRLVPAPGGKMCVQSLEPIRKKEAWRPLSVLLLRNDTYLVDFGQNTAGFAALRLPSHTESGQKITVAYAELLNENGDLFTEPLREAKATDTYICSGEEAGKPIWEPDFTYHGFRYIRVSGYGEPLTAEDLTAYSIYTDIEKAQNYFTCGSALVNQIHRNAVLCEKSNLHSIMTDCPQRDERMGWMNDATVRFEATPFNFEIGRLFPKVIRDILDVQDPDGSITCTAPFVIGARPADPVCSSFLIAGLEALLHTGNTEIIREAYEGFRAWEDCLLAHSEAYIVNYSYYGDWAAPAYACEGEDGAVSAVTPGILMSTGYSYYNCTLLEKFARLLGKEEDVNYYYELSGKIRAAFLQKWFNPESGKIATGSQACQVFPLWLGLIPDESTTSAVNVLIQDLLRRDYQITTGNLCTRYLFDVLAKYGHIDDAWEIITREDYPSFGYMIQNEATTIWERFELKKNPGMNSHNHPMYGAVDYWFYAYLCGIHPDSPGWKTFTVRPYFPRKLLSAHAQVETPLGTVTVKWLKQYGKTQLYVAVPFGATARVDFNGKVKTVTCGFHHFSS